MACPPLWCLGPARRRQEVEARGGPPPRAVPGRHAPAQWPHRGVGTGLPVSQRCLLGPVTDVPPQQPSTHPGGCCRGVGLRVLHIREPRGAARKCSFLWAAPVSPRSVEVTPESFEKSLTQCRLVTCVSSGSRAARDWIHRVSYSCSFDLKVSPFRSDLFFLKPVFLSIPLKVSTDCLIFGQVDIFKNFIFNL